MRILIQALSSLLTCALSLAAAVCTPTRCGLLTGRSPSRIGQHGVRTTYSKPIIPKSRLTVASLLQQNG
jgi:arylsulfatase A-like enzyme